MRLPPRTHIALRAAWFAALLAVIAGELLPGNSLPIRQLERLGIGDKVEHFTAYAILSAYPAACEWVGLAIPATFGLIALGVLLEFGQLLSVARSFEIGDMLANTLGAFAGVAAGLMLRKIAGLVGGTGGMPAAECRNPIPVARGRGFK